MKIAIDPAYDKDIAIAWSSDNKKIEYDLIKIPKAHLKKETRSFEEIAKAVTAYCDRNFDLTKDTLIIIEGQWFGRSAKVFEQLINVRALIHGMIIAKYPNVTIEIVGPITWQSKILDKKANSEDTTKIRSIKKAFELTKQTLTDDESDAVCMCKYAINYINNEK